MAVFMLQVAKGEVERGGQADREGVIPSDAARWLCEYLHHWGLA